MTSRWTNTLFLIALALGSCHSQVKGVAVSAPPGGSSAGCPHGMVRIPAGEFLMGHDNGQYDEKPQRTIFISLFCMDRLEVTNLEYEKCVDDGVCNEGPSSDDERSDGEDRPAVGVNWFDADRFCRWRGARLPTEAEWEKAARGPDGRLFPWGKEAKGGVANCGRGCEDFYTLASPVGCFPDGASPYGVLDMSGNAAEWVADYYREGYTKTSPERDPQGPGQGLMRVIKGGCFRDHVQVVRLPNRYYKRPYEFDSTVGFRCARDPLSAEEDRGPG